LLRREAIHKRVSLIYLDIKNVKIALNYPHLKQSLQGLVFSCLSKMAVNKELIRLIAIGSFG
jgi:hypothetical protein